MVGQYSLGWIKGDETGEWSLPCCVAGVVYLGLFLRGSPVVFELLTSFWGLEGLETSICKTRFSFPASQSWTPG